MAKEKTMEIDIGDVLGTLVDKNLRTDDGKNNRYSWALGRLEGRMFLVLNYIKVRNPEMFEEIMKIFFSEEINNG